MDQKAKNEIFREWVNQYYEYGFRIAFRIVGEEEECRDIVQDAFLKVWLKFETFNNEIKFSTWLYSIITNLCIDRLRKKKTVASYAEQFLSGMTKEEAVTENHSDNKELRTVLIKLTNNLSPKQKMVFVLRDMEELDMEEAVSLKT